MMSSQLKKGIIISKYKHHSKKGFLARMSYVSFQGYYPGVMLTMRKSDVG